jgi:hypothetical protein
MVDKTETPVVAPSTTPDTRRRQGVIRFVALLAIVVAGYFFVSEIIRLNQRMSELEKFSASRGNDLAALRSDLSALTVATRNSLSKVDSDLLSLSNYANRLNGNIGSLASDLATVDAIARNADRYAHSHPSDAGLKRDVEPYLNAMTSISKLRPVTFYWNGTAPAALKANTSEQIGLIAQEVEMVYPQLVGTSPEGYKTVDYEMLVPALIAGAQEQQSQIDALKSQINSLKQCSTQ